MKKCIISVGAITYALKARSVVQSASVRAKIVKLTPTAGEKKSCSYGLQFPCDQMLDVVHALRQSGISYELLR